MSYDGLRVPMPRLMGRVAVTVVALAAMLSSGCAVIAVVDATVSVTATVVKTGVKATGAVIGAVIPD